MNNKSYARNSGRISNPTNGLKNAAAVMPPSDTMTGASKDEGKIKVNGYEQVLAMLRIADPEFRESILRRLAARDPELASSLRATLSAN